MKKYYKIFYNIFRSFASPVFSFIVSIIGIRFFGKGNWGSFIYVWTIINFFTFLANFGNKEFLLKKYSNNPSKIITYFSLSSSSRVILLVFSFLLFFLVQTTTAIHGIFLIIFIYIYQNFESLIIYNQKFLTQLIAEISGFAIIIVLFFSYSTVGFSLNNLLFIYILSFCFKAIFVGIALKASLKEFNFSFSTIELKNSFSFFLIIFSSWCVSKIDLYLVNFLLEKKEIAKYQLAITAFTLLQSLSYLIIVPFNKHLYRLPKKTLQKIKIKLAYISFPLVCIGIVTIWFILKNFAMLSLPTSFYFFGGLASIPIFFYVIDVMMCYRYNKENLILKINLISSVVNLFLTYYLIHLWGIIGAIATVFISQLLILVLYKYNSIK